jgi:hypothetical protein
MTISASFTFSCSGSSFKDDLVSTVADSFSSGSSLFPAMSYSFANGSAAGQASKYHRSVNTIAANATQSFDLAGSLVDPYGATLTFSTIRAVVVSIVSPDGIKSLNVGPQGVSNAWQGPFGGVSSTSYLNTKTFVSFVDSLNLGWTVTAGTGDILPIMNSSAVSVQYVIWVLGT